MTGAVKRRLCPAWRGPGSPRHGFWAAGVCQWTCNDGGGVAVGRGCLSDIPRGAAVAGLTAGSHPVRLVKPGRYAAVRVVATREMWARPYMARLPACSGAGWQSEERWQRGAAAAGAAAAVRDGGGGGAAGRPDKSALQFPSHSCRSPAESLVSSRAEPGRAEQSRAGSSRAEPSRAEQSRAGSSRAEPSQVEPSRAEPSRAEPSRAEPGRAEPSRAEPRRDETRRDETRRDETRRAEPSRAEPSRAEPSRAEPSRAGPNRAEPSRAEQSRT